MLILLPSSFCMSVGYLLKLCIGIILFAIIFSIFFKGKPITNYLLKLDEYGSFHLQPIMLVVEKIVAKKMTSRLTDDKKQSLNYLLM